MHGIRGGILQEGRIFTLLEFGKFYMVSTLLNAMKTMVMFVSPLEFFIFGPFFSMEV